MKEPLGRNHMRNLKEWMEDKPPFFALAAYLLTTSALVRAAHSEYLPEIKKYL